MDRLAPDQLTQLLIAWGNGDKAALDALMPIVYDELRRLARHHLRRERAGHTLQTTALVNQQFGAFITSFRSPDEAVWIARRDIFRQQLDWWVNNTDVPLNLRLSGWSEAEVDAFDRYSAGLLSDFVALDGSYEIAPASDLIVNRISCLEKFYSS